MARIFNSNAKTIAPMQAMYCSLYHFACTTRHI